MISDTRGQMTIFFAFAVCGVAIGVLYSLFFCAKSYKKAANFVADALFGLASGGLIIFGFSRFCDMEIRLFYLLGIFVGVLAYVLLFKKCNVIIVLSV